MPGIIDSHTHYDAQVTWDALCDPSPALGVTTVVMGNCGFTIATCKPEDRKLMMGHLTRVEGMAIEALEERSEEHTSELQSLMRTTDAVFCWKTKTETTKS